MDQAVALTEPDDPPRIRHVIDLATPLSDLPLREPFFLPADLTIAQAAAAMRRSRVSSALIRGAEPRQLGIVTSTDLRDRVLAESSTPDDLDAGSPVASAVTWNVRSAPSTAPVSVALLMMLDEGFRHVPVTRDGEVIGLVSSSDILRHQAHPPMLLLARIHSLSSLDAVRDYPAEVAAAARSMMDDGLAAIRISRIVAGLNDALTIRLIELAQADLGPAPCEFAWLSLGSAGRLEQNLLTDQDNALVYADCASDGEEDQARVYFGALAARVNDGLTRAGFPPCPGGFMATNWCLPLTSWVRELRNLIRAPAPDALVEAAVFLDFRVAHGTLDVTSMDDVLLSANGTPRFMVALSSTAGSFPPPLRSFGRVRTDGGYLDLKRYGLYALVILARIYAMECASPARATIDRLNDAAAHHVVGESTARELADVYEYLLQLRLRAQLHRIEAGDEPDNRICYDELTGLEQSRLRDCLRRLSTIQKATAARLSSP